MDMRPMTPEQRRALAARPPCDPPAGLPPLTWFAIIRVVLAAVALFAVGAAAALWPGWLGR